MEPDPWKASLTKLEEVEERINAMRKTIDTSDKSQDKSPEMKPIITSVDTTKPLGHAVWEYGVNEYNRGFRVGCIYGAVAYCAVLMCFMMLKR